MDFSSLLQCFKDIFLTKQIFFIAAGIVGVGFLVAWHELGHFIFAKLFGVKVPTFSIGMGPKLIRRRIGETEFTLSAIPMGGYVEIAFYPEEPTASQGTNLVTPTLDAHRYFSNKPYWQKMLVLSGGIAFNLIFAYIAFIGLYKVGMPITPFTMSENVRPVVKDVAPGSPASSSGIAVGDQVTAVNGKAVDKNLQHLLSELHGDILEKQKSNQAITVNFTVTHSGQTKSVAITIPAPVKDTPPVTRLGIEFERHPLAAMSLTEAIKHGFNRVNQMIMMNFTMIKMMFKARSVEGIGGPVLMISLTVKSAEEGFAFFIAFLAFISIGLAIINLLPLPILDGGQALLTTIESLLGRPLPLAARNVVAVFTWILFIVLFGYLVVKDVKQLRALKKDAATDQKLITTSVATSPLVTKT